MDIEVYNGTKPSSLYNTKCGNKINVAVSHEACKSKYEYDNSSS